MNIIICSHPRSGTHLAIDLVRNNIDGYESPYISFLGVFNREKHAVFRLAHRLVSRKRVYKTHLTTSELAFDDSAFEQIRRVIFLGSLVVYVYRDGRDVMVSEYLRKYKEGALCREMSFKEYLRIPEVEGIENPVRKWVRHIASWGNYEGRILYVDFAQLVDSPTYFLGDVSVRVGSSFVLKRFNDMRMSNVENKEFPLRFGNGVVVEKGKSRTSVMFRRGVTGDFEAYFDEQDCNYFYNVVIDEATRQRTSAHKNHFNLDWLTRFAP